MKKYLTKTEFKWAAIFFVASLLWMAFEKLMGWHGPKIHLHPYLTNLFAIVAIALYVFSLRDKRKALGGRMTWKDGFFSGTVITLILTILAPLGQLITHKWITPEYFPDVINYAVEHEHMKREEMEAYFNLKSYMMQATIGTLGMGIVTSAIVSIFVKRK